MALADISASIRWMIQEMPGLPTTTLAATTPLLWHLPYPRNPFFLGRDAELAYVRSSLLAAYSG